MADRYPSFDIPDDFIVPEGVAEGETFEALGTFKLKSGGKMCIVKVDQSPLYADKKEKDEEPEDFGTQSGMESRITEAYRNR